MAATRIYKLSRGQTQFAVSEAAGADSSTGAAMTSGLEVRINLSGGYLQSEFLLALRDIENHIISKPWPPA